MEYVGLIAALRRTLQTKKLTLIVLDSLLILNQLRGIAKCHSSHLTVLLQIARDTRGGTITDSEMAKSLA
jgi:hypothetical protein